MVIKEEPQVIFQCINVGLIFQNCFFACGIRVRQLPQNRCFGVRGVRGQIPKGIYHVSHLF